VKRGRVIPLRQCVDSVNLIHDPTVTVDADSLPLEDAEGRVRHVIAMGVRHQYRIHLTVHPLVSLEHVSAFILPPYTTVKED